MGENEQNNSVSGLEKNQNEVLTERNVLSDGQFAENAEETAGAANGQNAETASEENALTEESQNAFAEAEKEQNLSAEEELRAAALAEEYARRDYFAARRYKRTPLILALVGLILSFFYGAGFAFSVAAIVTAAVRSRRVKSPNFKWALAIGITGAAICLVCYAMLLAAVCIPSQIIDI